MPRVHPLEIWRREQNIKTRTEAARILNISPSLWGHYVTGKGEPSPTRMREIMSLSNGQVTPNMIVLWRNYE